MDFEDQLDLFFIRKETNVTPVSSVPPVEHKKFFNSKNLNTDVFKCIPLMLKHIKNLNEKSWSEDTNVIKIFNMIQFKHCLVYGKIISKGKESKTYHNYVLDDGTSTLDISIFRRTNDMETIWKLENELQAIKREMLAQNKNEIVNSLRNLLFKTKVQIDHSNLAMGAKVLVYGKPTCYKGQTSIKVYSLLEDIETNRDIEIAFKDNLIDWYTKNSC